MATRRDVAGIIDHTLLTPAATAAEVSNVIAEATELGAYSVCVSPSMLPLTDDLGDLKLAVVCGFPSGKHHASIKAAEARLAVEQGADEIDMVINIGLVREGRLDDLAAEIGSVRQAAPEPIVLKVIIEAAALDHDEIVSACKAAESAGADFVKTSTGFHPSGGATVDAVRLMAETVGPRLGVKASGGIRDFDTAVQMIEAGATRLGVSSSRAILEGSPGDSDY